MPHRYVAERPAEAPGVAWPSFPYGCAGQTTPYNAYPSGGSLKRHRQRPRTENRALSSTRRPWPDGQRLKPSGHLDMSGGAAAVLLPARSARANGVGGQRQRCEQCAGQAEDGSVKRTIGRASGWWVRLLAAVASFARRDQRRGRAAGVVRVGGAERGLLDATGDLFVPYRLADVGDRVVVPPPAFLSEYPAVEPRSG